MNQYETMLRERSLKATHQRMVILSEIEKAGHIDVDTLYRNIHDAFPSLALGTLYRNLNDLKETGILTEVKLPERKSRYEISKEPHVHMVCESCGAVEDVVADTGDLLLRMEEQTGYDVLRSELVFIGTCSRCKTAKKSA